MSSDSMSLLMSSSSLLSSTVLLISRNPSYTSREALMNSLSSTPPTSAPHCGRPTSAPHCRRPASAPHPHLGVNQQLLREVDHKVLGNHLLPRLHRSYLHLGAQQPLACEYDGVRALAELSGGGRGGFVRGAEPRPGHSH